MQQSIFRHPRDGEYLEVVDLCGFKVLVGNGGKHDLVLPQDGDNCWLMGQVDRPRSWADSDRRAEFRSDLPSPEGPVTVRYLVLFNRFFRKN